MKKNLFCLILIAALFMPAAAGAIPIHNINLNLGLSLPGEKEICTYYNVSSIKEMIKCYNFGAGYDFAPMEYFSIGTGVNFSLRSFIMPVGGYEETDAFSAVEPYLQLRGYLPVMDGLDAFAGGAVGYANLIGSSIKSTDPMAADIEVTGGALTYKLGIGAAYNQDLFTAIVDIGYKIASIDPSPAAANPNPPGNGLAVNLGGFYFNVSASIGMGSHKEEKKEGEIKNELDKEVNSLDAPAATDDGSEAVKEVKPEEGMPALVEPMSEATAEPEKIDSTAPPVRTKEEIDDSFIESAAISATPEPAAAATAEPAKTEEAPPPPPPEATAEPVKAEANEPAPAATAEPEKADEAVKVDENPGDTDGIIILSPGESDAAELEKYITNKTKKLTPVEEESEAAQDSGEDLVIDYGAGDEGVIVVESETKGTVDRAGYVLVEKAGFISSNFSEDGFIYSLDEHKELLSQGDFAYIKLTTGIGAPKGKQFTIFDDSEEVMNRATGEPMGKMIKFLGVAKVTGPIEDNIFKVQINKSYDPIRNNYKIKARNDLKKYHKEINLKVRKKNLEVRAFIVKVKDDVQNLKSRDLVYLDAGIAQGLLPGIKMGIFRKLTDAISGKESEYDRTGTLIIINSMQSSSVGLIVNSTGVINVGDTVKTTGK